MIQASDVIRLSRFFSPISHTKGRLRMKVSLAILSEANAFSMRDIETLSERFNGVENIKINPLFQTVTINYNHELIPFDLWEDLLHQNNLESVETRLKDLERSAQ
ncbi:MAG: hypothetical protein ACTTIC_08055 [Helicobacteraceae bacterium]